MARLRRIWSGRWLGVPAAALTSLGVAVRVLRDRFTTLLARGNLGALGAGSVIQAGSIIRYPGQVCVGSDSSIASGVEISSEMPDTRCRIGSSVIIGVGVRIDFSGGLIVENDVVISENVTIYTHSHGLDPKSIPTKTPLVIERGVWIGSRALIIEGCARIGAGSVVAAGSVVTKEVPPGVVVAGVPARVIKAIA